MTSNALSEEQIEVDMSGTVSLSDDPKQKALDKYNVKAITRELQLGGVSRSRIEEMPRKRLTMREVAAEQDQARPEGRRVKRILYLLDDCLSKRRNQTLALVICGFLQVAFGGSIYAAVWRYDPLAGDPRNEDDINRFTEGIWVAWTFMTDPGTHAGVYLPEQRVVGCGIALGGIIFFAAILGIVVDIIQEKMELLRQGKSKVIEKEHTVVLGWTDKTILLIQELCLANESQGGGVIVLLANESKEAMELQLKVELPQKQRLGTRIVIRSGSSQTMVDLMKVAAHKAKSIVVLAGEGESDHADSETLRCMLSLRSLDYDLQGNVLAEVRDVDNDPLVKLVGGSVVDTVVSHDVLGRLMLMSARSPGLAKVYESLLGFEGDEFYFRAWDELVGLKFGEIFLRFPDAVPIGIRTEKGVVHMKPKSDHIIEKGDEIIVIAEDKDTYRPKEPAIIDAGRAPVPEACNQNVEHILFCGWRRDVRDIILFLDGIVKEGTTVTMMSHGIPLHLRNAKLLEEGLDVTKLKNLQVIHEAGNTGSRRKLEAIDIEHFTSCMIFADQIFEDDTMHADSHSLSTMLLFRAIQTERKRRSAKKIIEDSIPLICEILDSRTQKTIAGNSAVSLASDFCQTNRLVAQILGMVSENRNVKALLDELLGALDDFLHHLPRDQVLVATDGAR